MSEPTQNVHNGSDNNYHFNRLFCRDIKKSAVLTLKEAATKEACCDGRRGLAEQVHFYHAEINQ
jgi:hypothetical protein